MNISVIIPTKNREFFLNRSVDSVLPQLSQQDEIIIVDDGSDKSIKLKVDDNRIKMIRNDQSKGGAVSRNIGVDHSKNEIIMFLDDDDAWRESKVADQLELLAKGGRSIIFSGRSVVNNIDLNKEVRKIVPKKKCVKFEDLFECNYIGTTSSVTLYKSDFLAVNGFDEKLKCFQDYDLWIRILRHSKLNAVSDFKTNVVYTVFDTPGMQISKSKDYRHIGALKYLIQKYKNEVSDAHLRLFEINLMLLVSKSLNSYDSWKSLKYSGLALKKGGGVRSIKFIIASTLSFFGVKFK